MGHRSHHRHLWIGDKIAPGQRDEGISLCAAKDTYWNTDFTTDVTRVNCPKCAKALAEIDIERYNRQNPDARLELVRDEKVTAYRFAYRVLVGGEHVGYTVYDGAYANGAWYLTPIRLPDPENNRPNIHPGPQLDTDGTVSRWSDRGKPYDAKEQALLAVPGEVAKGELKSVVAMQRQQKEWEVEWARRQKAIATQDKLNTEARADALNGLNEILQIVALTNFQRNGVEFAINKLTPKKKTETEE